MTREEQRAYSKGYNTGRRNAWPLHQPPTPPDAVVRRLLDALVSLRDTADDLCAMLDEDDDFVVKLNGPIDEATAALEAVTEWLMSPKEEPPP